jgi:hypothetical protein
MTIVWLVAGVLLIFDVGFVCGCWWNSDGRTQ